ncbi:hypothetical protein EHM92_01380 [bacterium]|nr:MAG: hypothetical protein EHM92_01380 [bacterium]
MQQLSWLKNLPWRHIGAILFFALLMLFDLKVSLQRGGHPLSLFGFSVGNSEAQARNITSELDGAKFIAVRSDIWNCYHMRDNITFDFFGFVTIPDRCQERYSVVVQTESCLTVRTSYFECSRGTWRWVPNPPCGMDSPNGWWLPPC